jgi:hypothetical protein
MTPTAGPLFALALASISLIARPEIHVGRALLDRRAI